MQDYSQAPTQNDFSEMIPNGTLAKGILRIRPYNRDQGIAETPSKSSDSRYLDCEVVVDGGDFHGRKIWTKIGVGGSEKYVNMGRAAIRAILECGYSAGPQNPNGYILNSYFDLDKNGEGVNIAFKVKEEPEKDGYPAKNDIAVFLSPIPESGTLKDWNRLMAGDTKPSANTKPVGQGSSGAPTATARPAWDTGTDAPAPATAGPATGTPQQAQPAPATANPNSAPAWVTGANAAAQGDDEIPF